MGAAALLALVNVRARGEAVLVEGRSPSCAREMMAIAFELSPRASRLNQRVVYRRLSAPEVTRYFFRGNVLYEVVELARITHVADAQVQALLARVHALGGEVRQMRARRLDADNQFEAFVYEQPYFWLNYTYRYLSSHYKPVIAVDLLQPRALAALTHELQHLEIWHEEYLRLRDQGLEEREARHLAFLNLNSLEMIFAGETRAVRAELEVERRYPSHPFNRPFAHVRPYLPWHEGYVNRVTYPYFQVIREMLRLGQDPTTYVEAALETAARLRQEALASLPVDQEWLRSYWQNSSLYELLLKPFGQDELEKLGIFDRFAELVQKLEHARQGD